MSDNQDSKALQALFEKVEQIDVAGNNERKKGRAKGPQVLEYTTSEIVEQNGPIEYKTVEEIRKEPYTLPKDFEWYLVDLNDEKDLKDTYELLSLNYVEDDDAVFRFDYSAEFLKWALQPPGWKREWHIGVRVVKSQKMVGFISGVPADLKTGGQKIHLVEINFLCVHKKLRSKRLAPVLIKEVTRRVQLTGIFQAVYTAGVLLPKPFTTCRYYHRSINPKKLIEVGFSYLGRDETMAKVIKRYKLEGPKLVGWRPLEQKDCKAVSKLLQKYLGQHECAPVFSEAEVSHYLQPIEKVVYSFVLEQDNGQITDFVSFYILNSSVIGNDKHSHVNAAYLYYYVPKDAGKDQDRLDLIIHDAIVFAKEKGCDVFNCLNMGQNSSFIDYNKFVKGSGELHYYFYNYRFKEMSPGGNALVML